MVTPCRKCGATKTESVHHGLMYSLAKICGYRLRECSRCQRYRLLPWQPSPDPIQESAPHADPVPPQAHGPGECPGCGSTDYHRSRRRWWERLAGRGPMVRCRKCRRRFPMPTRAEVAASAEHSRT